MMTHMQPGNFGYQMRPVRYGGVLAFSYVYFSLLVQHWHPHACNIPFCKRLDGMDGLMYGWRFAVPRAGGVGGLRRGKGGGGVCVLEGGLVGRD